MGQEKEKAKDGKAKAVTKLFPLLLLRCCWCGAVCKIPVKKKCDLNPI